MSAVSWPDASGHFGPYGGRFVPETLVLALDQLEHEYHRAKTDGSFQAELAASLRDFAGRPTPLIEAHRFSETCGCRVFLKREDLLHTGAHKINNTIGQCLLTRRMGKPRVIAETGAGQHGVATAAAAARFGLECTVYMGTEDARRQHLNVQRMKLLGAELREVDSGSRTLKDAINEALRDWVTRVRDTHYVLGSVLGPHPFPVLVRDFHRVIGDEANRTHDDRLCALGGKMIQMLRDIGFQPRNLRRSRTRLPHLVVVGVAGSSGDEPGGVCHLAWVEVVPAA